MISTSRDRNLNRNLDHFNTTSPIQYFKIMILVIIITIIIIIIIIIIIETKIKIEI